MALVADILHRRITVSGLKRNPFSFDLCRKCPPRHVCWPRFPVDGSSWSQHERPVSRLPWKMFNWKFLPPDLLSLVS